MFFALVVALCVGAYLVLPTAARGRATCPTDHTWDEISMPPACSNETTSGPRQKDPLRHMTLVRSLSHSSLVLAWFLPPHLPHHAAVSNVGFVPAHSHTTSSGNACDLRHLSFSTWRPNRSNPQSIKHTSRSNVCHSQRSHYRYVRAESQTSSPRIFAHPGCPLVFLLTAAICAGAKQGIGIKLAKRLKEKRWNVFASVRSLADPKNN